MGGGYTPGFVADGSRMPDGPICDNCGAGWNRDQVRGREECPSCGYPFRDYRTPLHTGERHTVDDYVDLSELVGE